MIILIFLYNYHKFYNIENDLGYDDLNNTLLNETNLLFGWIMLHCTVARLFLLGI